MTEPTPEFMSLGEFLASNQADRDLIAEARAKLAAATPGPWETNVHPMPGSTVEEWFVREIVSPNGDLHPWNVLKVRGGSNASQRCCWPPTDADAELIVHMRNTYGPLLDELEKAQDLIAKLQGERVADEFGLQSLTAENGVATLTTVPTTEQARALVLTMSLACGRMLDDDQAQNYVEFEASPAGQLDYVVHVRRAGGSSPHTLRRESEARAAKAEARIVELERRLDRVTDLFEAWAAEENEHRIAGEFGLAEGLHVAIEALREAVHG